MGVIEKKLKPFTSQDVKNKELVVKMLKREDVIMNDEKVGQELYRTEKTPLGAVYAIHRLVLIEFGFDSSDESVSCYRTIFANYYQSPTDYDRDVLSAVTYMRENKCVYNSFKKPQKNEMLDVKTLKLFSPMEKANVELEKILPKDFQYAFFLAFSSS